MSPDSSSGDKDDDRNHQLDADPKLRPGIFSGKKKKTQSRESSGDARSLKTNEDANPGTSRRQDTDQITEKIILDATKALEELRKFGLEPASLKAFTISLHKLAVASGVSPNVLSSVIKEVYELFEGGQLSLPQIHKQLRELRSNKDSLLNEIEALEKKKQSVEVDLKLKELEYSVSTQILSEYLRIKKELEQHNLSITDIPRLVTLINKTSEQLGSNYSSSIIIETITDLRSKEDKRRALETEIENLTSTKRMLQNNLLTLEQEIALKHQTLNAAEQLKKMGFDFDELDKLRSVTKVIAQSRNIDESSAKNQLLSDIEGYYINDHELRKRIRILESLLQEKEEKFRMLEQDYQNEKAILDNAKELISEGFDRQWIEKMHTVLDAYGTNLDLLSDELKQQQGLKTTIEKLQKTKTTLEEEERLILQKVVAAEDQRLRTLSLIKEMMVVKKSSSSLRIASSGTPSPLNDDDWELGELVKAAHGNETVDEGKFKISAQRAIDIICGKLQKNSPARLVLEHALLALRYENERNRGNNNGLG